MLLTGINFQDIQTAYTAKYRKEKKNKRVEHLNRHFFKEDI